MNIVMYKNFFKDSEEVGSMVVNVIPRRSSHPQNEIIVCGGLVGEFNIAVLNNIPEITANLYLDTFEIVKEFCLFEKDGKQFFKGMHQKNTLIGLVLNSAVLQNKGAPSFVKPIVSLRGEIVGSTPIGGPIASMPNFNKDMLGKTFMVDGRTMKLDIIDGSLKDKSMKELGGWAIMFSEVLKDE